MCNLFSKYAFLYKVSTKCAQSLRIHLQELISQYGLPCLIYTDNGPPFASDEFMQFLQHNYIDHITSSPHFPRSNRFIERQIRTLKTTLSTTQESKKMEDLLLDLQLTLIGPSKPSPQEILHNRTFLHPNKLDPS